jgi:diguanylate cyclase (GGDEF)-like protein
MGGAASRDSAVGARRSWHPGTWGIAARLLTIVLLPLLGMLVFAASSIGVRFTAADRATEIQADMTRVNRLVALRSALFQERVPAEAVGVLTRLGIPLEEASKVFDMDVLQRLTETRAATDAAVAALGTDRSVISAADLTRIREATTSPEISELLTSVYLPVERRIDGAIEAIAAETQSRMALVPGVNDITAALRATQSSITVVEATLDQLLATDTIFLGRGDEPAVLRTVVAAQARAEIAQHDLSLITIPEIAAAWAEVRDSTLSAQLHDDLGRVAAGDPPHLTSGGDIERMITITRVGSAFEDQLFRLIERTNTAAHDVAARVATDARDDARRSLLLPGPLALLTLAVSVAFARSITRPMGQLADHAAAIGAGDLSVEPLRARGPRAIQIACRAFDDLVANLRLLDAKSQALADLDFDAPVLAEPLPGQLGQSLQRSVNAVSGSIGERDQLRQRLHQQATQDQLTGLHNRAATSEALDQGLARARRSEDGIAVLHIDLDDFKRINETHGNTVGDAVLCETATRLRALAGDAAFVGRAGGDEFVVLLEDVNDAAAIHELAGQLRAAVNRPVAVAELRITPSASVGIAFTWDGADSGTDVLAWAELAVHRAKQRAGGGIEIYDQGLQQQLREQAEIEDALTAALPRDELFLQYQPVIDLATGRMSSVEALVRWQRPDVGMQPPDSFIPVAERSDLIVDLDKWVMARAARQINEWAGQADLGDMHVAVNVSGRHLLSQTLFDHVVELLDATGIKAHQLVVEITETVLVNDLVVAAAQLEAVRGLGVRIALDDFGTGYTSIAHLRQLPIDIIKIDRSFVQRLASEKDRTLLAMITDLGHHLGLTITAEGVETAEQYDMLRQLGCDRAQGFLMSRPLPADALETWARQQDDQTATVA